MFDFSVEYSCVVKCPAAFIKLLCNSATTQTKNNSKNAEVIAMPSACDMANIVVWFCSIDPIACISLLCSRATTQLKKNSRNAQAIAMPSACIMAYDRWSGPSHIAASRAKRSGLAKRVD